MKQTRSFRPAWIVLGVFACVALAPSASLSTEWADVSKKLMDRCVKFEKEVKDMTADVEMNVNSPEGPALMGMKTYMKGDLFRGDIEVKKIPGSEGMPAGMEGMTMAVIGDGKQFWMVSSMTGKQLLPEEEAGKYNMRWRCSEYLPRVGEIVGSETVNGRDCHVVATMEVTVEMAKIWLDKETLDLVKAEAKPEDQDLTVMFFKDYKKVIGDFRYPFVTEIHQNGELISTITVKTVEVNKDLADALFDPDKVEVKGPNIQDMMKKLQEQEGENE
jgi:outer membrane lipoprotein-sorting protein